MRPSITTLFSFIVLAGAAAPALAFEDEVNFRFQSHELETTAGSEALYHRLTKRAEAACINPGAKSLSEIRYQEECAARLKADFIAEIDHARLDRIHARESVGEERFARGR